MPTLFLSKHRKAGATYICSVDVCAFAKGQLCNPFGAVLTCNQQNRVTCKKTCMPYDTNMSELTHAINTTVPVTAGYLSFHPMAQCAVNALKGLACQCEAGELAGMTRAWLHQSF